MSKKASISQIFLVKSGRVSPPALGSPSMVLKGDKKKLAFELRCHYWMCGGTVSHPGWPELCRVAACSSRGLLGDI